MGKIDETIIDKVRDAASIVDVVGDFVTLKKSGVEYDGLCPFHDDRHLGSFKVSPSKNIAKCFSCGWVGDPIEFVMAAERLDFPDAVRWLGRKYGIDVDEEAKRFNPTPSTPKKELPIPQNLPPRYWPIEWITAKLNTDSDLFVSWLYGLPWNGEQYKRLPQILRNYLVGHSVIFTKRDGVEKRHDFTLFPQIDDEGKVHNGHLMKYRCDGHRVKDKDDYAQTWIHARMQYVDEARTGIRPFNKYTDGATYCLFGLHLLGIPGTEDATINVVESEKTALICATAWGGMKNHIWMACCGLGNLTNTNDMLRPLIRQGRHIVLYPDRDGIKAWRDAADRIGYERLTVNTDFVEKYWIEADGPKADIGDVVLRMMRGTGRKKEDDGPKRLNEIMEKNPFVRKLVEKMNLKIVRQT